MKTANLLLTLTAAAALTGCSDLVSLHPFVTDEQAMVDPALPGVWLDSKDDALYIVRQDGQGYKIRRIHDMEVLNLSARLYRIGELKLLDVTSADEDPFQIQVHTPMRIWIEDSTLRFATLDSAWLMEHARKQLASQDVDKRALVTAPGSAVLRFLLMQGADNQAYDTPVTLQKQ